MCPLDPIAEDDPRSEAIAQEIQSVAEAATDKDAVAIVQWWVYGPTLSI